MQRAIKQPGWQLSRNGLFWVLFAFGAVIALHLDHLPPWVTLLAGACILWRILEYRGMVPFPTWPLKTVFVAACVAGMIQRGGMNRPSLLYPCISSAISTIEASTTYGRFSAPCAVMNFDRVIGWTML